MGDGWGRGIGESLMAGCAILCIVVFAFGALVMWLVAR